MPSLAEHKEEQRGALKEVLINVDIEKQVKTKQAPEPEVRSGLGFAYMLGFVACFSLSDSFTKLLFIYNPNLGVFESSFLRCLTQVLFLAILINKQAKWILWDCVPRELVSSLIIRILLGNANFYLVMMALKHLPVVVVTVVGNTAPLLTVIFGGVFLGEKITKIEVMCLCIAFSGVYVLLTSDKNEKTESSKETNIEITYLLMLLGIPILVALQNVLLRHMRGLHEYTVASYIILTGGIMYGICAVLLENDHSIGSTLSANGYGILAMAGFFGIFALVAKSKAFKYESASRLSILGYLSIIVMFLFDILVVGTTFTMTEFTGLLIIISATFLSAYVVFFRAKKN